MPDARNDGSRRVWRYSLLAKRTAVRCKLTVRETGLTLARSAERATIRAEVSAAIIVATTITVTTSIRGHRHQQHHHHLIYPSSRYESPPIGNGLRAEANPLGVYPIIHFYFYGIQPPTPRLRLALPPRMIYHIIIITEIPVIARQLERWG